MPRPVRVVVVPVPQSDLAVARPARKKPLPNGGRSCINPVPSCGSGGRSKGTIHEGYCDCECQKLRLDGPHGQRQDQLWSMPCSSRLGVNDRLGSTADGSSMADWTDEEKERKITIWAKPFDGVYKAAGGQKFDLVMLDTPGYADFYGQVIGATRGGRRGPDRGGRDRRASRSARTARGGGARTLGLPRGIVDHRARQGKRGLRRRRWRPSSAVWGARCVPGGRSRRRTARAWWTCSAPAAAGGPGGRGRGAEERADRGRGGDGRQADREVPGRRGADARRRSPSGLRKAVGPGKLVPVFAVVAEERRRAWPNCWRASAGCSRRPPDRAGQGRRRASRWTRRPTAPFAGHGVARGQRSVRRPADASCAFSAARCKADSEMFNATKEQKERIGVAASS